MRINITAAISRLCALCMGILGFGCSSDPDEPLVMYGTPTGDWEIKGTVTDEAGKAVSGASIIAAWPDYDSSLYPLAATETDTGGAYVVEEDGKVIITTLKIVCIPNDPTLSADSTVVELNYIKDKKQHDNFWYVGSAEATVDFVLKPADDKD